MIKLVIVYASTGGNTRETAELAAVGAASAGASVDTYNCYGLDASILLEAQAILLGEPTWGDGDHHADWSTFDQSMGDLLQEDEKLAGIPAAAFVGCDRAYRNFGRAVELIEDRLLDCGANVVQQGLKIELKHNDHSRVFTRQWGADFVARATGKLPHQAYRPAMTREEADAIMDISEDAREERDRRGLR